jgi:hypothetical protein
MKFNISIEKFSDKLIGLVLKVAKEQGLCLPENEGHKNENINFKLVEIEGE